MFVLRGNKVAVGCGSEGGEGEGVSVGGIERERGWGGGRMHSTRY